MKSPVKKVVELLKLDALDGGTLVLPNAAEKRDRAGVLRTWLHGQGFTKMDLALTRWVHADGRTAILVYNLPELGSVVIVREAQ